MARAGLPNRPTTRRPLEDVPRWARELRALFEIDFLDWEVWNDILSESIRDFSDADMAEAVRWMESEGWTTPKTAAAMRKGFYTWRKAMRGLTAEPDAEPARCPLCGGCGFFHFWPEIRQSELAEAAKSAPDAVFAQMIHERCESMVCECSAGAKIVAEQIKRHGGTFAQAEHLRAKQATAKQNAQWVGWYVEEWCKAAAAQLREVRMPNLRQWTA